MENIKRLYSEFLKSSGVTTDSRQVKKNSLFFALHGDHFDGNQYAAQALRHGARLAVVDNTALAGSEGYFVVDNSLQMLQELARYHRAKASIPVIGITGSNGKTTTKELIYSVLSQKFNCLFTQGNLNNHIGVPLTLLNLSEHHEVAVIEMGANHPGEIDFLSRIAQPDYGIITNIGKAHLEGFGSFEGVKQAKSELYRYLNERNGTIFIQGSNEILRSLSNLASIQRIEYFGGAAPICKGDVLTSGEDMNVRLSFSGYDKDYHARIRLVGAYNLENIVAAGAIGLHFGLRPEEIIAGLENYRSKNNRSEFLETEFNKLILDSYNANPSSMQQAIQNFIELKPNCGVLILGDMLELGSYTKEEHHSLLARIKQEDFHQVLLVGPSFFAHKAEFPFSFFESVEQLQKHLVMNPIKDAWILLKGSRKMALESLKSFL